MNANIISKVRKLLTTSADAGATPAEARSALAIAQRLMLQHRITEHDIEQFARNEARAAGDVRAEDMVAETLGPWKGRFDGVLAMAVGLVCGVGIYRSWDYSRRKPNGFSDPQKVCSAFGLSHDIAVARDLYLWLIGKVREERAAFCKDRNVKGNSITARSFCDGFANRLYNLAKVAKEEQRRSTETVEVEVEVAAEAPARTDGGPRALVVIGEATERHDRALAVKAKQLGIGKGRSRRVNRDGAAYSAGSARANSVNLSTRTVK